MSLKPNLKKTLFPLLVIFLFPCLRAALDEYPILSTEIKMSSFFGESRENHFHGGVDFSTFGKLGLPVMAAEDGYIYQLTSKFYGWGKVVYIRHKDFVSLYAHLDRFENEKFGLQRLADAAAAKGDGRYIGDLLLPGEGIPVKKGEVIAYSGNTGAGSAHLHFELRDFHGDPISPFKVLPLHDSLDPEIGFVRMLPLEALSLLNGGLEPVILKPLGGRNGGSPTVVTGAFGLQFSAWDRNRIDDRTGIAGWKFFVDGVPICDMLFDRLPFGQNGETALIFDIPGTSYWYDRFLYRGYPYNGEWAGKTLKDPEALFASLEEGEHTLTLEVCDFAGNKTSRSFLFRKVDPRKYGKATLQKRSKSLFFLRFPFALPETLEVQIKAVGGFRPLPFSSVSGGILFQLAPPYGEEKLRLRFRDTPLSPWMNLAFPWTSKEVEGFQVERKRDWIEIDSLVSGRVLLNGRQERLERGRTLIPDPPAGGALEVEVSKGRALFQLPARESGELKTRILGAQLVEESRQQPLDDSLTSGLWSYRQGVVDNKTFFLVPKGGERRVEREGNLELLFDSQSLFQDFLFRLDNLTPSIPRGLIPLGKAWTISPEDEPFRGRGGVRLRMLLPPGTNQQQVAIFRFRRTTGRWTVAGEKVNNGWVEAEIWKGGPYLLMADRSAPAVRIVGLRKGAVYRRLGTVRALLSDQGKGIDYTTTYFILNGERVWAEYDPDSGGMSADLSSLTVKGKNTLVATVKDYAGNESRQTLLFRIR